MKGLWALIALSVALTPANLKLIEEQRLEKGLRNLEPQAIVLVQRGIDEFKRGNLRDAQFDLDAARRLSPDMPYVYFSLAGINLSLSREGLFKAVNYFTDGCMAMLRNFWWSFHMAATVYMAIFIALILSFIVFIVYLFVTRLPLLMHDISEDRKNIFYILPMPLFILLGPAILLLYIIFVLWPYCNKREKIISSLIVISFAFCPLSIPTLGTFMDAQLSPYLKAVVDVNEGKDNRYAISRLKGDRRWDASFSYALALKREGYYDEAIRIYQGLLKDKADARVYNNMGNCYTALKNYDMAMDYYKKAMDIRKLVSTYYNISQVLRERLDFEGADASYREAIKMDPDRVSGYRHREGTSPNRFVMDETLSMAELWGIAFSVPSGAYSGAVWRGMSVLPIGLSPFVALIFGIAIYLRGRFLSTGVYICRRCGNILCDRCEKRITKGISSGEGMCLRCYRTLVKIDELEPKARIERILDINTFQNKRRTRVGLLSLILPGMGHLYAGKTIRGFLLIFAFVFLLGIFALWGAFFPSIPAISLSELRIAILLVAVLLYGYINLMVFRGTLKGWL